MRKTAGLIAAAAIVGSAFVAAPAHAAVTDTVSITVADSAYSGTTVDFVVTVLDSNGNPVVGTTVDASSTGVGYLAISQGVTDSNGQATLKIFAADAEQGAAFISAHTADAATAAATEVDFAAAPTPTDSVDSLTLAAASTTVQTGSTTDVVATALDADGNPVAGAVVSASSTGVGYLAIASGVTDDNGQVTLKFVDGQNDAGMAAINAVAGNAAADELDLTTGITDADVTIDKHLAYLGYEFAAGKKVVVKVDGKVLRTINPTDNAAHTTRFHLVAGTHTVVIRSNGVVLDRETFKVSK